MDKHYLGYKIFNFSVTIKNKSFRNRFGENLMNKNETTNLPQFGILGNTFYFNYNA